MKNTKKLIVAAIVLPLTLGTASAFAFGGKDHGRKFESKMEQGFCGAGMDRGVLRKLDLTDEQKEEIKVLKSTKRSEMKAYFLENFPKEMKAREASRTKAQELVLADTFDTAAASKLAAEMAEKKSHLMVKKMESQHAMLSVLTAEQKEKFVALQKEKIERCEEKVMRHMDKEL
ncbi:CpxP family protein [Marinomonas balearica]|uniref:Protein CpxP n=1 Tax=Marinomonas balearica TaxID=491947 RepID=A0A4R6MB39_9GAMM|nr:CpxP family protein [Marinomonas balearica]TDO98654.1 protein CpxP [Marinomonas balearica]